MNCLDVLLEGMAEVNIKIAVGQLRKLVGSSPERLGVSEEDYCRKVNKYAQLVYLGVRPEHVSVSRVRKVIIPLLDKAYQKIKLEGKPFDDWRRLTRLRRTSLEIMYCSGHELVMPQDVLQEFSTRRS